MCLLVPRRLSLNFYARHPSSVPRQNRAEPERAVMPGPKRNHHHRCESFNRPSRGIDYLTSSYSLKTLCQGQASYKSIELKRYLADSYRSYAKTGSNSIRIRSNIELITMKAEQHQEDMELPRSFFSIARLSCLLASSWRWAGPGPWRGTISSCGIDASLARRVCGAI